MVPKPHCAWSKIYITFLGSEAAKPALDANSQSSQEELPPSAVQLGFHVIRKTRLRPPQGVQIRHFLMRLSLGKAEKHQVADVRRLRRVPPTCMFEASSRA